MLSDAAHVIIQRDVINIEEQRVTRLSDRRMRSRAHGVTWYVTRMAHLFLLLLFLVLFLLLVVAHGDDGENEVHQVEAAHEDDEDEEQHVPRALRANHLMMTSQTHISCWVTH